MSHPNLKRGDKGDKVSFLQSQLNKTGAMLKVDGDFGPATETGVKYAQDISALPMTGTVESSLWNWLEKYPIPSQLLHSDGIAFIANEETGGLSYYNEITIWPQFPGSSSGITIGVGYDLRFTDKESFKKVWGKYLSESYIKELSKDIKKKGTKSRAKKLKNMGIEIPFKYAWQVFIEHTLPEYYKKTETIYPSLSQLPDFCRSVLVSLVYNRGTKLSGSRRKEMKNIQIILENAQKEGFSQENLIEITDELLSMKRLWKSTSGLIKRRKDEANLWRKGLEQI